MISRINSYSPAFGVVCESAIKQAIKDTKGNPKKLEEARELVESQKNDMDFFIDYVKITKPTRRKKKEGYGVFVSETGMLTDYYDTLKQACKAASKKPYGESKFDFGDFLIK